MEPEIETPKPPRAEKKSKGELFVVQNMRFLFNSYPSHIAESIRERLQKYVVIVDKFVYRMQEHKRNHTSKYTHMGGECAHFFALSNAYLPKCPADPVRCVVARILMWENVSHESSCSKKAGQICRYHIPVDCYRRCWYHPNLTRRPNEGGESGCGQDAHL